MSAFVYVSGSMFMREGGVCQGGVREGDVCMS